MVKFHEASSSNSIFEKRKRKGRQRFSLCIGSPYSFFFVNDRVFRRHASRTEREREEKRPSSPLMKVSAAPRPRLFAVFARLERSRFP